MIGRAVVIGFFAVSFASAAQAGFLQFPLHGCYDAACNTNYGLRGAYAAGAITSVLDHTMKRNPANSYFPYGDHNSGGGDEVIYAFNGEHVSGTVLSTDDTCVHGTINLHPDWDPSKRMTNDAGCGLNYSSYDEHPGYDYLAVAGTPVYAAAEGYVLPGLCYMGNTGLGSCTDWGAVGIDHSQYGHNYISQYFHMSATYVLPGAHVSAGQLIGLVGAKCNNCTPAIHPHLHFEVRAKSPAISPEQYPVVDPYGWVGGGLDPLYSANYIAPQNLWQ
jgi:murein DD-endopeptidase MepM/ murein hydrolase activator NlpD